MYDTAGELDIKFAGKFNLYETATGKKEVEKNEVAFRLVMVVSENIGNIPEEEEKPEDSIIIE